MKKNEKPLIKKSALILSLIAGFFFAFFLRTESDLFNNGNIVWNEKYLATLLIACLCGSAIFGGIYYFIKRFGELRVGRKFRNTICISSKKIFFGSFILNIIAFLPFFLAYYPGIMAYDFPVQLEQILNSAYNNHHPLAHTLMIKGCLVIGESLFKSSIAGVAICTFIQMLFLAVSLAFVLFVVNECGGGFLFKAFLQVLFCFQLFNGYLAVSITKDVIFTGFVLIFLGALVLSLHKETGRYIPLVIIGGIGVCLFRNNGKYALIVATLVSLIVFAFVKKNKKLYGKLFVSMLVALITGIFITKILSSITSAMDGDKRELLSVPIQQLARVAVYEKDKLTEEEQALIDEFLLYNSYEDYNPVISDPVKGNTNTSVVRYQTARFARIYMQLLENYTGDFVNAFLCLIGGYVSPLDETYRIMWVDGKLVTRNYIQHTFTAWGYEDYVYECSLLPGLKEWFDSFAEEDRFNIPVLKIFFIPGIYLWIYLGIFIYMVDKSQWKMLIPWIFALAYFATLLLGPTMNLRYIYPLMVSLPLFILMVRMDDK